jgi:hypothetical protein
VDEARRRIEWMAILSHDRYVKGRDWWSSTNMKIRREPRAKNRSNVVYTLDSTGNATQVFSDTRLPDGSIVRKVDAKVHEQALKNAAKALRKAS